MPRTFPFAVTEPIRVIPQTPFGTQNKEPMQEHKVETEVTGHTSTYPR